MMARHAPRLTAIGSGKGGTGKTLIAVSLAYALSHEGERVLLCDADLGLSNTSVHLGLESGGNLPGLLAGDCGLRDATVSVLGGAAERGGFDLLAAAAGSGSLADFDETYTARLVAILKAERKYDRVLLDLGAGVDSSLMHFAAASDETIVVLTPDPAALTDAYAFVKILMRAFTAPPFVVVNMSANDAEGRRTADALTATCRTFLKTTLEYLGAVPRDPRALEALRRQCHLLRQFPQAPSSRAIETIATRMHARMTPRPALVSAR
jgi:flagellar biosynthesis protein FlhG